MAPRKNTKVVVLDTEPESDVEKAPKVVMDSEAETETEDIVKPKDKGKADASVKMRSRPRQKLRLRRPLTVVESASCHLPWLQFVK